MAAVSSSQIQNIQEAYTNQNDRLWGQVLHLAAIVAGVWTAVMFGGFGGAVLGLVSYLALTKLFVLAYREYSSLDKG